MVFRSTCTLRVYAFTVVALFCAWAQGSSRAADTRQIVFIAGAPSHGPGEHEHRAGCLLLKQCIDQLQLPGVSCSVYSNGWPSDASSALGHPATLVVYSDGGGGHPLLRDNRLEQVRSLMDRGVGLVCLHYAVEPTIEKGEKEFLDWIGGCFELNWSVNPTWTADYTTFPSHPVTRGVIPFKTFDEWYFHMRFRPGMDGVTPVLSAVPPASTMNRGDGGHEGNPAVRESVRQHEPQHMAWACERPNGGRGFGFTGGHYHKNWGDDNVRKLVINAILWTAHIDVPATGASTSISPDDLKKNLDAKTR